MAGEKDTSGRPAAARRPAEGLQEVAPGVYADGAGRVFVRGVPPESMTLDGAAFTPPPGESVVEIPAAAFAAAAEAIAATQAHQNNQGTV